MEMLCPECMSQLKPAGPTTAVCPGCSAQFNVLFSKSDPMPSLAGMPPLPSSVAAASPVAPPVATGDKITVVCPSCADSFRVPAGSLGRQARCLCGNEFMITMAAPPAIPPSVQIAAPVAAILTCSFHPGVPATCACNRCRALICTTCGFAMGDGTMLCPTCAVSGAAGAAISTIAPAGRRCQRHPEVAAAFLCRTCGASMCPTCDFVFPGNIHLCPTCATSTRRPMSSKRKALVGWALGMAAWSTIGMVLMFSGLLAREFTNEKDLQAFGVLIGALVGLPSLIGGGLGISSLDRRLGNPPIVWVTAIWNILLLSVWLLLVIIGSLKG